MGQYLCRTLSEDHGNELHGTYRTARPHSLSQSVTLHQIDLCDQLPTIDLINRVQPEQIYHLAGNIQAGRGTDLHDPVAARDNFSATLFLYMACLRLKKLPKIVLASTGAVYGQPAGIMTETLPLKPLNAYAHSKAGADMLSSKCWVEDGLPVVRTRLFNYLGPGQDEQTALSRFAHELARLERSNASPAILNVGNLDAERDFTDIDDLVRALRLLMKLGEPGEAYNVASGVSRPMRWYLDELIKQVRIPIEVRTDPTLIRTAEAQRLQVDISKLQTLTGWKPTLPLHQTLAAMMETCRATVAKEGKTR
ncbi:MAG: GDP-mannose 4,6-dehydratase [Gemmatales bacterium]